MRSYSRADRVNELIKEEISFIIQNRLKDPRIGFLTVLNTELTKDMGFVKVYVSIYGDEEVRDKTIEALESARGFIRKELGTRVRMRSIPDLVFIKDESEDIRHRIDLLLREAKPTIQE